MPRVYTGGTFDLFHTGHVELLQYCREFAGNGKVIVALNTDDFITRFKNKPPAMNYGEREDVLKACIYIDEVVPNESGEDSRPTILKVKPDIIVIGMDWLYKDYCFQMGFNPEWLTEHRISLIYVPRTRGVSTTQIRRNLEKL